MRASRQLSKDPHVVPVNKDTAVCCLISVITFSPALSSTDREWSSYGAESISAWRPLKTRGRMAHKAKKEDRNAGQKAGIGTCEETMDKG